jgi:hypothetical protein
MIDIRCLAFVDPIRTKSVSLLSSLNEAACTRIDKAPLKMDTIWGRKDR